MATRHKSAQSLIFALVLDHESFFGEVGGLPNVHDFLKECASDLREILTQRWRELLPGSTSPLVVDVLINPHLLFCHRDSMRGQYRRYFRPVYLDENAIRIDRGEKIVDTAAEAIVNLHEALYEHYEGEGNLEGREFLSLNDIEAILKGNPLPPADTVISIWRINPEICEGSYEIHSDGVDYWEEIKTALQGTGISDASERFNEYLARVTNRLGSYHHVTIGSKKNWVGRVYLAFRDGETQIRNPEWLAAVKDFAFDVVAPIALAGTFIRNPGIIEMLDDVRELLHRSHETRRLHTSTLKQFSGSSARVNCKFFPTIDDVNTRQLFDLRDDTSHRLHQVRNHFREPGLKCHCKNVNDKLTHALEHCNFAGSAFLTDISDILKSIRAFEDLPPDTVTFLANALAFGLTEDETRPRFLKTHFEGRTILSNWIDTCRTEAEKIPKPERPFIRALLLMVGNQTMVRSDAGRLGITIESEPVLTKLEPYGRHFLATVEYQASGNLTEDGEMELDSRDRDALHAHKNMLLMHFGKNFLDDFRMCITTFTRSNMLSRTYRWSDPNPARQGTVTYGFKFLR